MPKRLIDLDDDLLDAAKAALRTSGVSDTVRRALEQAAAAEARARQVQWLTEGGMSEMADADARADVWR
jgi:Arc/MetJ family transcription regulator